MVFIIFCYVENVYICTFGKVFTPDSRYEVLEQQMDKDGRTVYKRMGVIKPVEGKIWDNRYMAADDLLEGSDLTNTTFQKVSGGHFYPGMLIREIK